MLIFVNILILVQKRLESPFSVLKRIPRRCPIKLANNCLFVINCREGVKKIQAATSVSTRKKKEAELGFRDSVFLSLPYFNIIRQTIVDPMHNLLSGRSI